MTDHANCIFCKIVQGEIPSAKIYEDEHVYAFLDISQVTKGHTLVIPKAHQKDVFDLTAEVAANLYAAIPEISNALKQTFSPVGLNILNNNGEEAGQTVFHYHLHLIPRHGKDDDFGALWKDNSAHYSGETLQQLAGAISASFEQK